MIGRVAAGVVLLLALGCAGVKARENVLMPAMAVAWSEVLAPVLVDGGAAADAAAVQVLLDSGDASNALAIGVLVEGLLPVYQDTLDAEVVRGSLGVQGRLIMLETWRQFELALFKLRNENG